MCGEIEDSVGPRGCSSGGVRGGGVVVWGQGIQFDGGTGGWAGGKPVCGGFFSLFSVFKNLSCITGCGLQQCGRPGVAEGKLTMRITGPLFILDSFTPLFETSGKGSCGVGTRRPPPPQQLPRRPRSESACHHTPAQTPSMPACLFATMTAHMC